MIFQRTCPIDDPCHYVCTNGSIGHRIYETWRHTLIIPHPSLMDHTLLEKSFRYKGALKAGSHNFRMNSLQGNLLFYTTDFGA